MTGRPERGEGYNYKDWPSALSISTLTISSLVGEETTLKFLPPILSIRGSSFAIHREQQTTLFSIAILREEHNSLFLRHISTSWSVTLKGEEMKRIAVAVVVATIFSGVFARELPEFLHVCKRDNPNLGECMKNSVENIRPYLVAGLPEYHMPSLEPLMLKELVAAPGTIKLRLRNVNVYGASNFTVSRLKANLDRLRFVVELNFPNLFIKGDYDVDGKVILLRLRGSGPMTGNFTNCKGLVKLQAEKARGPDGENYLRMVDFKTKIAVAQGKLRLENLFGGDPVLGEAINMAINTNFDSFLTELQPSIESAISDTFLKIANSILDQFTYDSLFPLS